ncbi:MAG: DUF1343 domain-containing protein [Reichenbachiella sp.]
MKYFLIFNLIQITLFVPSCTNAQESIAEVKVGAENLNEYIPLLDGKNIALLVNHTSTVDGVHLLDTLLSLGVNVVKIFAPEHGFRGNKSNGAMIDHEKDSKSGLPIISLYGKNKKPTKDQLTGVDIVLYDIQDVGARFYTYISAMHYMMDACADIGKQLIILDRPNPNGHFIDGPILKLENQSYVGMHPIPIVYGLTSGELAQMIVGESWLTSEEPLQLMVIKNKNWNHSTSYSLPITPSPNLPNKQSIDLYPSLCLFEGTVVSVGRGTNYPFQVIGVPDSTFGDFSFTPKSLPGISKYPKFENETCYGKDLRNIEALNKIDLNYLINFYNSYPNKEEFFNTFFTKLAGTKTLRIQIEKGFTASEIRESWQSELLTFKEKRAKYLLYD